MNKSSELPYYARLFEAPDLLYTGHLTSCVKGIVSRDWEDLQNDFIGLITVEVFNVSASGFIFIFSSASSRIVMRLTICPNLIFQNGVLCTVLP